MSGGGGGWGRGGGGRGRARSEPTSSPLVAARELVKYSRRAQGGDPQSAEVGVVSASNYEE